MSDPDRPGTGDQRALAELTIQFGSTTETHTVISGDGNVMAAVLAVTTAAIAVHRRELVAQWEQMKEALTKLGALDRSSPPASEAGHTFAACSDPFCAWHRQAHARAGGETSRQP